MQHSLPVRGVALILASGYLLAVLVVVAIEHKPVCRLQDAVRARSVAERFSVRQDYEGAERTNLAAARLVVGCRTGTAARVGLISLARAGAAFGQRQFVYALEILGAERSSLNQTGQPAAQSTQRADPFRNVWQHGIASTDATAVASEP